MEKKFKHYSAAELNIVQRMKAKGKTPQEVTNVLGRDLSSVARHFKRLDAARIDVKPVGRPPALTETEVDLLVKRSEQMIKAAN